MLWREPDATHKNAQAHRKSSHCEEMKVPWQHPALTFQACESAILEDSSAVKIQMIIASDDNLDCTHMRDTEPELQN